MTICRIWRGWTTPENAEAYEAIVRGEVIPEIERRRIPGFLSIDLVRRPVEGGFEFATIMWLDDLDSVKALSVTTMRSPTCRSVRGRPCNGTAAVETDRKDTRTQGPRSR